MAAGAVLYRGPIPAHPPGGPIIVRDEHKEIMLTPEGISTGKAERMNDTQRQAVIVAAKKSDKIATGSTIPFLKSLPEVVILDKTGTMMKHVSICATGGVATGVVIAACTGPFAPADVIPLTALCAGVGAVGGVITATIKIRKELKSEFLIWRREQNTEVFNEFVRTVSAHESIVPYVDGITNLPMVTPAICNCPEPGHTFELTSLQQYVRKYKRCPGNMAVKLKIEQITVNFTTLGQSYYAYRNLLQISSTIPRLTPRLIRAVQLLCDDVDLVKKTYLKSELESLGKIFDQDSSEIDRRLLRAAAINDALRYIKIDKQ